MNVFAEELGLPVNQLAACWEIILSGQTRGVDFAQNETNDRSVELHHFSGAGHRSPGAFIANPSSRWPANRRTIYSHRQRKIVRGENYVF